MFQELSITFGVEYAILVSGFPKDLELTIQSQKNEPIV